MSKITNNENMRRYVHMKLSNGGASSGSTSAMMIAGTWLEENDYQFTPNDGQPTFDDAVAAFKVGRNVVLHITDDYELNFQPAVANYYCPLLNYEDAGEGKFFTYRADGENKLWLAPSDEPDANTSSR